MAIDFSILPFQIPDSTPTLELLESLVPGVSLKQGDALLKAVRRWLVLRSFCGRYEDEFYLGTSLQYPPPREKYGQAVHWKKKILERIPDLPQRTLRELLNFTDESAEKEWVDHYYRRYLMKNMAGDPLSWQKRPFHIHEKSYKNTFKQLGDLLHNPELVSQIMTQSTSRLGEVFLSPSLGELLKYFEKPIQGNHRFFVALENIIPLDKLETGISAEYRGLKVLLDTLNEIWQKSPVPPIRLHYRSAKFFSESSYLVYPLCFYYISRAPYLFAYGQVPSDGESESTGGWYDYRLDRIQQIEILAWDSQEIKKIPALNEFRPKAGGSSQLSSQLKDNQKIEEIKEKLNQCLGYDWYQPQETAILRFPRSFYENYMRGTEREFRFHEIPLSAVIQRLQLATENSRQVRAIAQRLKATNSYDIYCQVCYFSGDNNVLMRLRAWGPNVEVILPSKLRLRMQEDLQKTWEYYSS